MKSNGNPGGIVPPQAGGHGTGAPPDRDELIIVHSDEDFDIDAVFRSEEAPPVETPEAPQGPPVAATPDPPPAAPPSPRVAHVEPARPIESVRVVTPPIEVPAPPLRAPLPAAAVTVASALQAAPAQVPLALAADIGRHDSQWRDRRAAALLIADLIDNHVRLEWHEAVAIAQHLCQIMAREPGANLHRSLVEPWNIEITDSGEVQVLPGGSSSDPIVKQVGRVLRVLLQDSIAPAELRLVASQASFEVPVYSSVDELSAALRHFERPDHADAIRSAFNRGLEAKLSGPPVPDRAAGPPVVPKPVESKPPAKRVAAAKPVSARPARARKRSGLWMIAGRALAASLVAATAVFITVRYAGQSGLWSIGGSQPPPRQPTPSARRRVPPAGTAATAPALTLPVLTDPAPRPSVSEAPSPSAARGPAANRVPASAEPRPIPGAPREGANPVPTAPPGAPENIARPAAPPDSIEASLRRAGALLAEGRDGEAAVILDGIVMKNPLYQPDPERFTPETLAAFQSSKRLLLPAMARRYLQEGRVALDGGDFTLAITKGERAQALLRDADIDPASQDLNDELANLIAQAASARTLEETRIYTSADRDVTPPRPIGRQLSAASVSGRAPLTGRLELVVDRKGEVETVRLETPVNGYHDRMIVSAAKAWRYRPATRKGRPVRYSMVMSITLPDF